MLTRTVALLSVLTLPITGCDGGSGADDDDAVADGAPVHPDADPSRPDADPSAPDADPAAACSFDDSIGYSLLAETVQLESAAGDTCVLLTRRNDCPPDWICKAVPFTLLTFYSVHDGDAVLVDDPASLHWEATHHNWNDWGEALTATVRYRLESRYADEYTDRYQLFAYDAVSSAPLWGPVELLPYAP